MPRLRNAFSSSGEISSSSSGTMRGRASSRVTSLPKDRKMDANSTPTAPAPTMTTVFGMRGTFRMSRLPTTTLPSNSTPGSDRASEPVANIICSDSTSVVWPSASTATRPAPAQRPQPRMVSILCLRKRYSIPLACLLTILSLRARTAFQSTFRPETSMPNSRAFLNVS